MSQQIPGPVVFTARCPSCGKPVEWKSIPSHGNNRNDPGGQPAYKFNGCVCDRRTPYLGRAA
jgi:hypothetical protein